MRHDTPSIKRPSWLIYATKVKAKINQLRRTATFQKRRDDIVYRSYQAVKEKHRYPGTLGDWDFIVEETKSGPQNGTG